jgi:hypothetical protein
MASADLGPALVPDRPSDLVDVLLADHRRIGRLLTLLRDGVDDDPEHRRDLADVAVAELVRHAAAEEQYLYPAVRQYVPDGDRLADRELATHGAAEVLMRDLLATFVEERRFDRLVAGLVEAFGRHVDSVEGELLPPLRATVEPAELYDLGTAILSAKKLAPTRPHPGGPHRPPLNKFTAPVLGLVDQARDSLTDRPTTVDELLDRSGPDEST